MCKNGRWYPNTYAKADGHGQSTPASQLTEEQSAIAVNFCVAALAQDVSCSKEYIGVAWNNGNCWCVNAGDNCAVTKDHYWQYKLTVGHLLGKLESEISALTARVRQLEKDQDPADHNSADHNSADQEDIEHSAVEGRVHKSTPLQSKRIMQALIDRHHAFLHNGHALVLLSESSSINASPHDQCAGVQKPVSDKLLGASAAPTPAPTPSRPPTHTPTPVPTHVPTPSDDGDVRSEPHLDGTASQVEENVPFVPEVWHKATAKWYPICVGHFVNNEEGAITICNKLGFSAGAIVLRPDPKRSKRLVEKGGYMSMIVGLCEAGEPLNACTGGYNYWGNFGDVHKNVHHLDNWHESYCSAPRIRLQSFEVVCSRKSLRAENDAVVQAGIPFSPEVWYVNRSTGEATWHKICNFGFGNGNNGATTVCNRLGFHKGIANPPTAAPTAAPAVWVPMPYGSRRRVTLVQLSKKAPLGLPMYIGVCRPGEPLNFCTGDGNYNGGDFNNGYWGVWDSPGCSPGTVLVCNRCNGADEQWSSHRTASVTCS
jgi:hypothetical protein